MGDVKIGYIRTSKKDQNPEIQRRDLLAARRVGFRVDEVSAHNLLHAGQQP
jgi:DNA invertase Pin-like site-specific DNA recombinase